jgi:hypothetical protein
LARAIPWTRPQTPVEGQIASSIAKQSGAKKRSKIVEKGIDTNWTVCNSGVTHGKNTNYKHMRTKALLCAAVLAAGAITSMAQSNVYSLNVVGYVNVPIVGSAAGSGLFTFIANPLNTTNNTLNSLMPAPPDGTTIYKWTGSAFANSSYLFGAWSDGTFTLNPGEGGIVQSTAPFTNTFVGEVMQGALSTPYKLGLNIIASQVPQAGTLSTQLGYVANDQDTVYQFNPATQGYIINSYLFGAWGPAEPTIAVGESFWLQAGAAGSWSRTFTVQ